MQAAPTPALLVPLVWVWLRVRVRVRVWVPVAGMAVVAQVPVLLLHTQMRVMRMARVKHVMAWSMTGSARTLAQWLWCAAFRLTV